MSEKENVFKDILTPDAFKRAELSLFNNWNVNSELSRQTSDAVTGLTALLYSVKKANISSQIPENAKYIEQFKHNFDMIAYCLEGFIAEFKPLYEQMVDAYVTEKLAGTFEEDKNTTQYGVSDSYVSGINYVNPIRAKLQGWDDGLNYKE